MQHNFNFLTLFSHKCSTGPSSVFVIVFFIFFIFMTVFVTVIVFSILSSLLFFSFFFLLLKKKASHGQVLQMSISAVRPGRVRGSMCYCSAHVNLIKTN